MSVIELSRPDGPALETGQVPLQALALSIGDEHLGLPLLRAVGGRVVVGVLADHQHLLGFQERMGGDDRMPGALDGGHGAGGSVGSAHDRGAHLDRTVRAQR